jgi:potassium-transporting ATPase KdpC subunit
MLMRLTRPAVSLLIVMTLLLGVLYPLAVTLVAKVAFRSEADGSLVYRDGKLVGSTLIGQSFSDPKHFWGRPSATTPQPYNALASTGSNLGPLNPALLKQVEENVKALRAADPDNHRPVPVDLVTASASGLDPHITPAAAYYQAARVARAHNLPLEQVDALIAAHEQSAILGVLGERRVNVLELNLALDRLH